MIKIEKDTFLAQNCLMEDQNGREISFTLIQSAFQAIGAFFSSFSEEKSPSEAQGPSYSIHLENAKIALMICVAFGIYLLAESLEKTTPVDPIRYQTPTFNGKAIRISGKKISSEGEEP